MDSYNKTKDWDDYNKTSNQTWDDYNKTSKETYTKPISTDSSAICKIMEKEIYIDGNCVTKADIPMISLDE